jgi:hypothetical protein
MSHERFIKKEINRIYCSIIFIFFLHGGIIGRARAIFLKRDKLETQLAILGPHRGHALKNNQEHLVLIPLIQIIFENEMKEYILQ